MGCQCFAGCHSFIVAFSMPIPAHSLLLSLTSWHASCYANTPRQLLPSSASLASLLGKKCTGIENAMHFEQFKAGPIGLAR
jgi:hypothetical protein